MLVRKNKIRNNNVNISKSVFYAFLEFGIIIIIIFWALNEGFIDFTWILTILIIIISIFVVLSSF